MLSRHLQEELAERYGGAGTKRLVKRAFTEALDKALDFSFDEEIEAHSSVAFIDVAGFSSMTSSMQPSTIRQLLDDYYSVVVPHVYKNSGHIDRIAGDGIVAVFSTALTPDLADEELEDGALKCVEKSVLDLSGTKLSSKGAVATGPLAYCKTGLAGLYEDRTVVGRTITTVYRLEEKASQDQVLLPFDCPLGKRVWQQVQVQDILRKLNPGRTRNVHFHVESQDMTLRGVRDVRKVLVETHV